MPDNSDKGSLAAAFIAGAAVGVAVAIMTAPKSGKQTRDDLKNMLGDKADKLSSTLKEGSDTAKSKISEALDTTKTVAREGKRAAKEAKQRVEENRKEHEDE